ncbi:SGNH/GDSL hydrolase family protein [Niabella ginsengisoli]|uniref:SGNH/GDSL hydrolase family protein n=1 Tax=Niabella ginsengisoli TaxID=522298 RepID=A0ABS9SKY6_9BACT|nr:SGNH/GDSL hydrolase family protein [Niabella ginsengisoli]MCH5598961.1 SGNH/GDSL hydrolase family protein [Niabella ginsengisoli]
MRHVFFFFITILFCTQLTAQKADEFANLKRYATDNESLLSSGKKVDVVFIGNSITEAWVKHDAAFFSSNNYVGRGISGQTSSQMLLRFQQDVVALKPKVVVINAGTNDIALNAGNYDQHFTFNNIKSMAAIAKSNGIIVILTSVLPAGSFPWRPEVKNASAQVDELNGLVKKYAIEKGFSYIDYNLLMRNEKGGMKTVLADDGIHPNKEGYKIMEEVALKAISKNLKKK